MKVPVAGHLVGPDRASRASRASRISGLRRTSSATTVQFMVHSRGMKLPVASQKGAMLPSGSTTAWLDTPKSVPDVPREITQVPSCTSDCLTWCSWDLGALTAPQAPAAGVQALLRILPGQVCVCVSDA